MFSGRTRSGTAGWAVLATVAAGAVMAAPATGGAAIAAPGPATCDGMAATIVGTSGADHLIGTAGDDVIVGLGGDDRIEGGPGDDRLCGLAGAEEIQGGPGADRVFGGTDSWWFDRGGANRVGDRIWPGPGRDYVDLGADRRPANGFLRRDTLVYRELTHAVVADLSPGAGMVLAQGRDDVRVHSQLGVIGTRFDDDLVGSPKGDTLVGGWGDDVIEGRGGGDDLRPDYFGQDAVHADADTVTGGNGRDEITSWSGPDQLDGGPGADFFDTRSAPDAVVRAGSGDDGVSSAIRARSAYASDGGPGRDYLFLDYTRRDDLPATTVDLRVSTLMRAGLPDVPGTLAGYEQLELDEDAVWSVYGTDAAEEISGARKAWTFGGDDKVYATGRDDFVDAGDGDDLVWAYGGTDTCLHAEHARSCEIRQPASRSGLARVAPAWAARPECRGRRATIVGTPGRDQLVGTPGDDVIVGLGGDDHIRGGAGDDLVCGNDGADRLVGGLGADLLHGGADGVELGSSPGGAEYDLIVGDVVSGGPGDDLLDLGFDVRQRTGTSERLDLLSFAGSARGVRVRLAPDGRIGTAVGQGHDRIAGQHALSVLGSDGPDRIAGSPYGDEIAGGAGDDVIFGVGGNDLLADQRDGGHAADADLLDGGRGKDQLISWNGPDRLRGGSDRDDVTAFGSAVATLAGGLGKDYLGIGRFGGGCTRVDGGDGRDELALRPAYRLRHAVLQAFLGGGPLGVRRNGQPACGRSGGVEKLFLDYGFGDGTGPRWRVTGTPGDDSVRVFDAGSISARMLGGDDVVHGGWHHDELLGGPGNDYLRGAGGVDLAVGGPGVDDCPGVEHPTGC